MKQQNKIIVVGATSGLGVCWPNAIFVTDMW